MLSPEVWNFQPPQSHFIIKKGNITDENFSDIVCNSFYNHVAAFILPDTVKYPDTLAELLTDDTDFYKVKDLNVDQLVEKEFLDKFVKKGNLTLLSVDTRIDCDNCICITPSGKLILLLLKDTYQTLGIDGKLSYFSHRNKDRYIIQIDLLRDNFKPGKNNYERIKNGLKKLEKMTIIMNWHPPTVNICPSSIAKYFDLNGYEVQVQKSYLEKRTEYSINIPIIDVHNVEKENVQDFSEWLGMLLLNGDMHDSTDYLSTYELPEPCVKVGQVKILEIKGLLTIQQIESYSKALKEIIVNNDSKNWMAMYVQGFSDSLLSLNLQEHDYFTNGDYSTLLVISPAGYLVCKQKCTNKYHKYK